MICVDGHFVIASYRRNFFLVHRIFFPFFLASISLRSIQRPEQPLVKINSNQGFLHATHRSFSGYLTHIVSQKTGYKGRTSNIPMQGQPAGRKDMSEVKQCESGARSGCRSFDPPFPTHPRAAVDGGRGAD